MSQEMLSRIVFWVLLGLVVVMRWISAIRVRKAGERFMPDKEAIKREGKAMFISRVLLFLIFIAFLALYTINTPWIKILSFPISLWILWTGAILGFVTILFWTWAQIRLGKEWSPQLQLRKEHRLVTSGPYSKIRHPIYTSMMGMGISFVLVTANWIFIGLAILVIIGLFARVPKEEKMMIEQFGDEYKKYIQNTGKFFPKISIRLT